jgi:outer membrane protein TolC
MVVAGSAGAQAPVPVPLSLGDAVSRAAGQTAGVQLAGLRVEEARARVDEARSALLPHVSADAVTINRTFNVDAFGLEFPSAPGTVHQPLVGPFDNFDARLHLSQAVFDPAAVLRTRSAREAVKGSSAEQQSASETAAQRAAQAYLRATRADAKLAARRADAALADELLDLAQQQLKAGVSPGIDVTRARTQKAAADGQVLVAQNAAQQAQIELARAVGMDPATRFQLTDGLPAVAARAALPLTADSAVSLAVARRPELQQAVALTRTAEAVKRAIRAERLPRLALIADYGASGLHATDAIATRQIGLQVSVPVFEGMGREARLQEQSAVQREGTLRSDDLRQQIAAEVQSALLDRSNGQQQTQVAQEQLGLAEQELSEARERFTNGVAGNIELITAQASLLRARDTVIDAQFATATAQATLARAVGMAAELR